MKNILLVVDMQKGFARYEQTVELTSKIKILLERQLFDVVIATKFYNGTNSSYEKLFNWHRLKTDDEQELPDDIKKYVSCTINKSIYNCVNADFIQKLCQLNDGCYPTKLFIVGADTDCCVLTIATSLFEHNIRPIVLTKYCDSNGGPISHEAGITCMKRLIGQDQLVDRDILSVDELQNI